MGKRFRRLMLIGLLTQGYGAAAVAAAAAVVITPVGAGHAPRLASHPPIVWRSSSDAALAVAILNDLARRRSRGRGRRFDVRDPASLAKALKRVS